MGDDVESILFESADVIVIPGNKGHAKLARSVSRKFIDLAQSWFTELPEGWVN